jgi:arylsulfatase A-like enzyme
MTADEAVRVLGEIRDRPFFLGVGFLKPHLPFIAPKRYWDLYQREKIDLADNPFAPKDAPQLAFSNWGELRNYFGMPKEGPVTEEQARTLIHGYLACVSYTDAQIGRVLDELQRLGLADNTAVVLWGDHGWKLGEHGMWCKHTNFELDAHAPMICAVPGQKAPGSKSPALTEFVDIYPSLCDACGLEKPAHLEGTSFTPLLDRPDRPWKSAAFSQYPRGGGVMGYSMRTDRYRFTRWQNKDGSAAAVELYDHQKDPKENVNVAGLPENAALVEKLTAQLQAGWKAARPA